MYFVTSFFFLFYQKILFNVVLISWDNIAQIKTLCNVVQEAPDNIAQVKILFNFVLTLLGQHCAGKNPVQFCPNTLRTTLPSCNGDHVFMVEHGYPWLFHRHVFIFHTHG